jgi:hypothetical protein
MAVEPRQTAGLILEYAEGTHRMNDAEEGKADQVAGHSLAPLALPNEEMKQRKYHQPTDADGGKAQRDAEHPPAPHDTSKHPKTSASAVAGRCDPENDLGANKSA